jgi:hypothetical protein
MSLKDLYKYHLKPIVISFIIAFIVVKFLCAYYEIALINFNG